MTINPESVPTTWTTADETFFRLVSDAFSPTFLAGAGTLLASYDDEVTAITTTSPASAASPTTVEATVRSTR